MSSTNNTVSISAGGSVSIGDNAVLGVSHAAPQPAPQPPAVPASAAAIATSDPVDVFISYSRPDRGVVDQLAALLSQAGYSVWYDRELTPGNSYQQEITDRLESARAVVVVWSKTAIQSQWVLSEAEVGRRRGVLVAVALEPILLPPPHALTHAPTVELGGDEPLPQPVWRRLAQLKG